MFKFLMADNSFTQWSDKVWNAVDNILVPILVIACAVGVIYAIVIGVKMMKAEKKEDREENKARLINIAISIVAMAVLIGLFYALRTWLNDDSNNLTEDLEGVFGEGRVGSPLMNTVSLVKQCVSMLF